MNQSVNNLFKHIASNRSLEDTPIEKLKILAETYPYFPVAQFFFAKKLKDENSDDYSEQSQKSILYFSNPYWFDHLISTDGITGYSKEDVPVEDHSLSKSEAIIPTDSAPLEQIIESASDHNSNGHAEENITSQQEYIMDNESEKMIAYTPDQTAVVMQKEEIEEIKESSPDLPDIAQSQFSDQTESHENEQTLNDIDTVGQTSSNFQQQASEDHLPESEDSAKQDSNKEEPDEHEKMFRNIKAMLDASSQEADADINNTEIPIDPYYTIDYFASQGIKLDLENPQDQLSQNLKRFTQWLRHMKKLGPEDAKTEIEGLSDDVEVQKMADKSNNLKEVVTEAMAAVLEKQGKKGKAIELYTKLSFLNPDKSLYFAAQIEKLKGI